MDEFELIDRYFKPLGLDAGTVDLGIGDDCAVIEVAAGEQLVVTTDTHVESVHFPVGGDPEKIGFRACATSLSDIAAMGATARWATLGLTLPQDDGTWIGRFAHGAATALRAASTVLIGGDTTRGPLNVTWTILGTVPKGTALRRDGAAAGDCVYVSGTLGGARAALDLLDGSPEDLDTNGRAILDRYWHPQPRLSLGRALRGVASSCIDISDGLIADVTHIARRSRCGVEIELNRLPLLPSLVHLFGEARAREFAASGGDDYELCFTVPQGNESQISAAARSSGVAVTQIGRMTTAGDVRIVDETGNSLDISSYGYRHFN